MITVRRHKHDKVALKVAHSVMCRGLDDGNEGTHVMPNGGARDIIRNEGFALKQKLVSEMVIKCFYSRKL